MTTKKARRPDVFDRDVIVERFIEQGLARSVAEPLASDLRLIIPILISELGTERINEILQRRVPELHLSETTFWPNLTPHVVRWADDELDAYRARKEGTV